MVPQLVTDLRGSLGEVKTLLNADKVNKRKDGVKKLQGILNSPDYRRAIDSETIRLAPSDSPIVSSWPGIVLVYADFVLKEVKASLNKTRPVENNIPQTMRQLLQLAEDDRRSGRKGLLIRVASKLFTHVTKILDIVKLNDATTVGTEYAHILKDLLKVPEYCAATSPVTFEKLLELYYGKLGNDRILSTPDAAQRILLTITTLLTNCPGELSPTFQIKFIKFVTQCAVVFVNISDLRLVNALLEALNAFLIRNGLDVASFCPALQDAMHPLVKKYIQNRDPRNAGPAVTYLRLQLQLGGLVKISHVADYMEWAKEQMMAPHFKWNESARESKGRRHIAKVKHAVLTLFSNLWVLHSALKSALMLEDNDDGALDEAGTSESARKKRQKTMPPLAELPNEIERRPSAWAPLPACILRDHAESLPDDMLLQWLKELVNGLPKLLPTDGGDADDILWAFRYIHALALSFPKSLVGSNNTTTKGLWSQVWDATIHRARLANATLADIDAACWVLAALVERNLLDIPAGCHELWRLDLFERSPTLSTVHLLATAFRAARELSVGWGEFERKAVQWLVTAPQDVQDAAVISDALSACLGFPQLTVVPPKSTVDPLGLVSGYSPLASEITDGKAQWKWWDVDQEFERRLGQLLRGEALMRHRKRQALEDRAAKVDTSVAMKEVFNTDVAAHRDITEALKMALSTIYSDSSSTPDGHHHQQQTQATTQVATAAASRTNSMVKAYTLAGAVVALASQCSQVYQGAKRAVPQCWKPESELGNALAEVLKTCSGKIQEACLKIEGIHVTDQSALEEFVALVDGTAAQDWKAVVQHSFVELLKELNNIYENNDSPIMAVPQGPNSRHVGPLMPTIYDEELDGIGSPGAGRVIAGGAGAPLSSNILLAQKARCISLLSICCSLVPKESFAFAKSWTDIGLNQSDVLSPGLLLQLISVETQSASLVVKAGHRSSGEALTNILDQLSGEDGVLHWDRKISSGTALFIVQNLLQLATAAAASPIANKLSYLQAIANAVISCANAVHTANVPTTRDLRIALATVVTALFVYDAKRVFHGGVSKDEGDQRRTWVVDLVMSLTADEAYTARLVGARLLQTLFEKFDNPMGGFDEVLRKLNLYSVVEDPDNANIVIEKQETAVFTLAETAASCDVLELDCLLLLATEVTLAKTNAMLLLVQSALDWVAAKLGYADRYAYFKWHRKSLFHAWFAQGLTLEELMCVQSLVAPSLEAAVDGYKFLDCVAPYAVPALMLEGNGEMLASLCVLSGIELPKLLRYLDVVLGAVYPGAVKGQGEVQQKCSTVLYDANSPLLQVMTLAGTKLEDAARTYLVDGIANMLLGANNGHLANRLQPPFYPPAIVVSSIYTLAGGTASEEEAAAMLWKDVLGPDQVARLLLRVQENLGLAKHARHQLTAMGPLAASLQLLGQQVYLPATFRQVMAIILRLLAVPELQESCCQLLTPILNGAIDASSSSNRNTRSVAIEALGTALPDMISSLVAAAVHDTVNPAHDAIHELLLKLTQNAPPQLKPYLRRVDPIPALPELEQVVEAVKEACQGVTALQQLLRFAERAPVMSRSLRHRSLIALRATFNKQDQSSLYEVVDGVSKDRPEVAVAAWRLVTLSTELEDTELAVFAGEMLALVGPLDPQTIAFDASLAAQAITGGSGASGSSSSSKQSGGKKPSVWTSAVRLLSDYLVDENVDVNRVAQHTLRLLLATTEGRDALKDLPQQQQQFVEIFAPEPGHSPSAIDGRNNAAEGIKLDSSELWKLDSMSFEAWVCQLAGAMLSQASSPALNTCQHMAHAKPAFAELLLPLGFADIARNPPTAVTSHSLGEVIRTHALSVAHKHPKAMRLLFKCLNTIRSAYLDGMQVPITKSKHSKSSSGAAAERERVNQWPKVYWIDVDYLQLATAAAECRAFFTALLYTELWCHDTGGSIETPAAEKVLLDVYSGISEPDGIYAVSQSSGFLAQLRLAEHEGDWAQALVTYDLALQLNNSQQQPAQNATSSSLFQGLSKEAATSGLVCSLSRLGATHLLKKIMGQEERTSAAALGSWGGDTSYNVSSASNVSVKDFSSSATLPELLSSLQTGNSERCADALSAARAALVAQLGAVGMEAAADVNPALVSLQVLQVVSEAWELRWPGQIGPDHAGSPVKRRMKQQQERSNGVLRVDQSEVQQVLSIWGSREHAAGLGGRYDLLAPLQEVKRQVLQTLGLPREEAGTLVDMAVAARKTGHYSQAASALFRVQGLQLAANAANNVAVLNSEVAWQTEEAQLLWARGQHNAAVRSIRKITQGLQNSSSSTADGQQNAFLLSLQGKWLAQTRSASSDEILKIFKASARALGSVSPSPADTTESGIVNSRIYFEVARYADGLYKGIVERLSSPEWATSLAVIEEKKRQVEELTKQFQRRKDQGLAKVANNKYVDERTKEIAQQLATVKRTLGADQEDRAAVEGKESELRTLALQGYGRCLQLGGEHDLQALFRIIQLWFKLAHDAGVNKIVAEAIEGTAPHKMLPLVYQMASRLSASTTGPNAKSGFLATLTSVLVRLCQYHPYHALPQIFGLRNGNRDQHGRVVTKDTVQRTAVADEDKVAAAANVLQEVEAAGGRIASISNQMAKAIEVYITLAATAPARDDSMPFPGELRRALKALDQVPVLSTTLDIDPSCEYNDIPNIASISETIKFVGGINKPKLVTLVDSMGVEHKQLVKGGNDDLRQDAVMQQFFWLLNRLLEVRPEAAMRNLKIRTYKVLPFSPCAGLLQWVEHTLPIGEYLAPTSETSNAAHTRYKRPGDYSIEQVWGKANALRQPPLAAQRKAYDDICAHFPPVFRVFFLEMFRDPGVWFERRLQYARSLAASSMAGYILGLGDRHLSNILIDKNTAEVVHIDLGIAFEQGRFLYTPELVPFRLTRDLVDGLGVTGVEGVMRRCCEETLQTIRGDKDMIMTVVEVFIHDPLYKWALTAAVAQKIDMRQADEEQGGMEIDGDDDEGPSMPEYSVLGNADAERTLLRMRQKLEGIEGAGAEALGVEGQVQLLLHEAMDPALLSQPPSMFRARQLTSTGVVTSMLLTPCAVDRQTISGTSVSSSITMLRDFGIGYFVHDDEKKMQGALRVLPGRSSGATCGSSNAPIGISSAGEQGISAG